MSILFLKIIQLSILASWITLFILILRFLFNKMSKRYLCLLWGFVAIRLIFPINIQSIFSIIPKQSYLPINKEEIITNGMNHINNNLILSDLYLIDIMMKIWMIGMFIMLMYLIISTYALHKKVMNSTNYKENIYLDSSIDTAFILGVIKPKIYLPNNTNDKDLSYMILHEQNHIKRKDHLWKPLGYLLLSVYWFNPMMWIAYIYMCKDIELACDEGLVEKLETEDVKDYMHTLLKYSVLRKNILSCPLAFGEVGIKERIKSMMNYKKKSTWMKLSIIAIILFISVGCMTNPKVLNKEIEKIELEDKLSKLSDELNIMNIKLDILSKFRTPVDNLSVTCGWACYENHMAFDVVNRLDRYGSVYAVNEGEVLRVGEDTDEGYFVEIKHDNGVISHYGCLGEVYVESGQKVKKSESIAQIGMSGKSTGPHVHFYLMYDNYILEDSLELLNVK